MQETTQREPNMTDSELKEFLKDNKTAIEMDCWVTNYSKTVNTRGQARLKYKNKMIFLYQLSHLLFNSNVSNLTSIFHKCNNLICFNPAHLTDDLKEKKFKLEMPASELLEGCSTKKDKKKILIDYGNWLFKELGRPPVQDDFEVAGRVSFATIARYFDGSMCNYFNSCDFLPIQRKLNMSDSEMRKFLKDIAIITKKGCWLTDYWKTSDPDGRIKIGYKGKTQYLSRISYTLFKGSIPDKLLATHSCDNPSCFNPEHLFSDTHKGNMEQAVERGRLVSTLKRRKYNITDPDDYEALLNSIKPHIKITEKDEWIFPTPPSHIYPIIIINNKSYLLHRLILALKLGKKYDEIDVACHRLPDGSVPDKRDVNPIHLFEDTSRGNALDAAKYSKSYKLNIDKVNQVKATAVKSDFSKRGSKTSFDKEWAAKLNVSKSCIESIRTGRTWNQ